MTISSGHVNGGTVTFAMEGCLVSGPSFSNTPDVTIALNFWCEKATHTMAPFESFQSSLNGRSTLTITPGQTRSFVVDPPTAAPTLSECALMLMASLLALASVRVLRRG